MRSLLAVGLLLTACSSLPAPTPPPEGAYGYVRQDGQTETTGVEGLTIVAVTAFNTVGLMVTDAYPTAVTDSNGNFQLSLMPGTHEICFVDGGYAVKCDCQVTTTTEGETYYRYFLRQNGAGSPGSWQGQWYGHDEASSCDTMKH